MAGEKIPPLSSLDKPENYKDLLKEDRGDDCLGCRIIGWLSLELPPSLRISY